MSTYDKFTMAQTDIVTFQPVHEQSPKDIFNFDTKNIHKFTHKEKSILLSNMEQSNSKKALEIANNTKTHSIHANAVQNIIFNKLYDEGHILCNVQFHDDDLDQLNSKAETETGDALRKTFFAGRTQK